MISEKTNPLVYKVEDLMPLLNIGRNTAYSLVRSGRIKSIKIGRTYRVPQAAVQDYLSGSVNHN